jgi:hypothetical protein
MTYCSFYDILAVAKCLHAYVLTRAAAVKVVNEYDICLSSAVDAQMTNMHRQNIISYRFDILETLAFDFDVLYGAVGVQESANRRLRQRSVARF